MTGTTSPRTDWDGWLRRYDAVLEGYVPARERRFDVLLELLELLAPASPTVLDLGAGPGALAGRLLRRLPGARCVALDADPVLLELGRRCHGDHDGRLRWVEADLLDEDWVAAAGEERIDAVVTSAALHYLSADDLVPLYRRLAGLLPQGGVFLNADLLPVPAHLTAVTAAVQRAAERREAAAFQAGTEDWRQWWEALRGEPALADAFARRDRSALVSRGQPAVVRTAFHEQALGEAGFREVTTVWQDLEERVLLAIR